MNQIWLTDVSKICVNHNLTANMYYGFVNASAFLYADCRGFTTSEDTLFIDECGDPNLEKFDKTFPIFTLCGVLMSDKKLSCLENEVNGLKQDLWGNKDVIFHSREIRNCSKDFVNLLGKDTKSRFYSRVNEILGAEDIYVISYRNSFRRAGNFVRIPFDSFHFPMKPTFASLIIYDTIHFVWDEVSPTNCMEFCM